MGSPPIEPLLVAARKGQRRVGRIKALAGRRAGHGAKS